MKTQFQISGEIGEGTFSKLYKAYDTNLKQYVALKVEKDPQMSIIIKHEFNIYQSLQDLNCIPKVYQFFKNFKDENSNFHCGFSMQLLGKSLSLFLQTFPYCNHLLIFEILIKCLLCIKNIHNKGYIHRDIKPGNFCIDIDDETKIYTSYNEGLPVNELKIYLVDFGLSKKHLSDEGYPFQERPETDFRGTFNYASLNAHRRKDLGRVDDLWSFFFMALDLLNFNLPWKKCCQTESDVKDLKEKFFENPDNYLFCNLKFEHTELINIFHYLNELKYESFPDYDYILNELISLKNKENIKFSYYFEKNMNLFGLKINKCNNSIEISENYKNESPIFLKQENISFDQSSLASFSTGVKSVNQSFHFNPQENFMDFCLNNQKDRCEKEMKKILFECLQKVLIKLYPEYNKILINNNIDFFNNFNYIYNNNQIFDNYPSKPKNDKELIESLFISKKRNKEDYIDTKSSNKIKNNKNTSKYNISEKKRNLKFQILKYK